jgi:ABC-type polar amino acid transport system ATPase subunit
MPPDAEAPAEPVITVEHLHKRFGRNTVLEDVNLRVQTGEVVALIGPSGAGKSTFLRCLNYLHPFERGRVRVLDHEIVGTEEPEHVRPGHAALTAIRARVGMVFQTFNLFPHLTVLENITLGPVEVRRMARAEADALGLQLLSRVGLRERARTYPRRLSGGQQQRVAICRALAMQPQVMLFDEPTSMLDPELVGEVLAVIRELAEDGMTMCLATHEMSFARDVADTVVFMAERRVVEAGPAVQVLTDPRERRTRVFLRRVLEHAVPAEAEEAEAAGGGAT